MLAAVAEAPDVLFCTESFHEKHRERFDRIAPDIEVVVLRDEVEVSSADIERITIGFFSPDAWPERAASFMAVALSAPNMKWFHTMSAGVDHPVFQTFIDNGAILTNSSGTSAPPIAGTAMMYLLALARDLPRLMRAQAQHEWAWERWRELTGRSVAVLGWGPIGQQFARLADAHGMKPTIVRRSVRGDEGFPTRRLSELGAVLAEHDAVVLALPLNDDTREIISRQILASMKPGTLFVNVGRGELVDQAALVEALESGHLAGAGLDVTDPEPLPADDPLWGLPNVIITPHNSGSTDGTDRRAGDTFFENLERWVAGAELLNQVSR